MKRCRNIALGAFFLLACLLYAWTFASLRMERLMWAPATFQKMVEGTALTPFQYRSLVPWTVDLLRSIPVFRAIGLEQFRFSSEFLFAFLLLVTFRAYVGCFVRTRAHATLSVLLLAWALPFHYLLPGVKELGLYYVYDLPSVFFFTLGLLLLYKRRWLLYYPVFVLATFNRETTCFLTLIYLVTALPLMLLLERFECKSKCTSKDTGTFLFRTLTRTRTLLSPARPGRSGQQSEARSNQPTTDYRSPMTNNLPILAAHCAAQFAIWVAVKGCLSALYGGSLHELHYSRNIYLLRVPSTYLIMTSVFGYLWLPVLLGYRRIRDDFVRRSLWTVPVFFAGMFIVAQIYELRQYGEMIPVVLGAASWLFLSRVRRSGVMSCDLERI